MNLAGPFKGHFKVDITVDIDISHQSIQKT